MMGRTLGLSIVFLAAFFSLRRKADRVFLTQTGNVFDAIAGNLPEEITQTLLEREGVRIESIVSTGQASPEGFWYDQAEHEWVLLLTGSAGLEIEGEVEVRTLKIGDFLLLPAHQRHRVVWTDTHTETIWLAIFFR